MDWVDNVRASLTFTFIQNHISHRTTKHSLTSLLSIFLIECTYTRFSFSVPCSHPTLTPDISTSYVSHLQARPSAPPSPSPSRPPSLSHVDPIFSPAPPTPKTPPPPPSPCCSSQPNLYTITDQTPLLPHAKTLHPSLLTSLHPNYITILSKAPSFLLPYIPRNNKYCVRARGKENVVVVVPPKSDYYSHRAEETGEESGEEEQGAEGKQASTGISRRRQVIGILVRAPSTPLIDCTRNSVVW